MVYRNPGLGRKVPSSQWLQEHARGVSNYIFWFFFFKKNKLPALALRAEYGVILMILNISSSDAGYRG